MFELLLRSPLKLQIPFSDAKRIFPDLDDRNALERELYIAFGSPN
jgi:hypothetical protein